MKSVNYKLLKANIQVIILVVLCMLMSCKKSWLDAKSDKTLAVPGSLKDLQAILDNEQIINGEENQGKFMLAEIGEIGSDNVVITNNGLQSASQYPEYKWQANAYLFSSNLYEGYNSAEMWNTPYKRVFYANVVLDELAKMNPAAGDLVSYSNIKGTALFTRSYVFLHLLAVYSKAYDKNTADNDPGIPLRLSSDLNLPSFRENVKNCYDRIINDLKEAATLLPNLTTYKTRPSKAVAYALLARTYLLMGEFEDSMHYAESALKLDNKLMDYSLYSATAPAPFQRYNEEVLYSDIRDASFLLGSFSGRVDMQLYASFAADDLRKTLFFTSQADGLYSFKGSYDGSANLFYGIAKDEVYLILAESYARNNRPADAMKYLNDLLRMRWAKNPDGSTKYTDATATDSNNALNKVLIERRKQLVFRGIRWPDLKRLNKESVFQTTVKHVVNGVTYELAPNSPKYLLPIPNDIIQISGITQNLR